jgi:prevent-host-death family protein
MRFASVRELKNQASELLRLAAGGKDVLVTSHGRPIAVLYGVSEGDISLLSRWQLKGRRKPARANRSRRGKR